MYFVNSTSVYLQTLQRGGRRGHDRMVVGFTTIYAISAYHY
jgi:hypothetical protein